MTTSVVQSNMNHSWAILIAPYRLSDTITWSIARGNSVQVYQLLFRLIRFVTVVVYQHISYVAVTRALLCRENEICATNEVLDKFIGGLWVETPTWKAIINQSRQKYQTTQRIKEREWCVGGWVTEIKMMFSIRLYIFDLVVRHLEIIYT